MSPGTSCCRTEELQFAIPKELAAEWEWMYLTRTGSKTNKTTLDRWTSKARKEIPTTESKGPKGRAAERSKGTEQSSSFTKDQGGCRQQNLKPPSSKPRNASTPLGLGFRV